MGLLVRAFAMLKGAWDWFSFGSDAVTALGLVQRAAVATAGAAAIAGTVAVVSKPGAGTQAQPAAVVQTAEQSAGQVRVEPGKEYSKLYLTQPEHKAVLDTILAKCKDTNEIPAAQCDIAVAADRAVKASRREAAMREAFRRAAAEQAGTDSRIKLPGEYQLVK